MKITACSSHGTIDFDSETGVVISQSLDECDDGCPNNIARFDVEEYTRTYGHKPDKDVDILDLGYWLEDESYEEPAYNWREETNLMRAGGEFDDFHKIPPNPATDKKVMVKVDLLELSFIGVVMGGYLIPAITNGYTCHPNGVTETIYMVAGWAGEFYDKFKNADWDEIFLDPPAYDLKGDVDSLEDAVLSYSGQKYSDYLKTL